MAQAQRHRTVQDTAHTISENIFFRPVYDSSSEDSDSSADSGTEDK
jgi:hypothetical protein